MSLLDTASLIVTPNGYKEGKLYSVIPSDGSGDLSVTRATTATRVNSAGLVELVPYNLFSYSSSFSNAAWGKLNATVTGGQSGYDGTTNAFLVTDDSTNAVHLIAQTPIVSGQHTVSIYAKANTLNWLWLRGVQSSANVRAWFDLSTGTVGTVETNGTANIENVGNGWYRCELTIANHESGFEFYVGVSNANGVTSYVGSGQSLYIQDAQLVEGSVAKDYQKTETRLNIPRLDYSNGTCPSILVEPQRTNVCRYSNNLSGADWINQTLNTTLTRIQTGGVDGNAFDRLVTTGSGGLGRYVQTSTLSGSNAVWSVYLRGTGQAAIGMFNAGQSYITNVTLTSDWTRYECKITSGTSGYMDYSIYVYGGSSIDVSSCQLEFAAYATSYIPTTAASVTRNADVISKTGISSLIGQTEGTIFLDVDLNSRAQFTYFALAGNISSSSNYLGVIFGSSVIGFESVVSASLQAGINFSNSSTGRFKIACAYKQNDFVMYINGNLIGTDTSGNVPACNDLSLAAYGNVAAINYNSAALWKTRLTNTQLAQLTTI